MPVLNADNLKKAYGPDVILDGVSLTIRRGEKIGLVGINGGGKSTLARILAGIEQADLGDISRRRGVKIQYLEQDPQIDPTMTARSYIESGLEEWYAAKQAYDASNSSDDYSEAALKAQEDAHNQFEAAGGWGIVAELEALAQQLGVADLDGALGNRSGGEKRRVALARLLISKPDLAILDEPTNHLDADTIEWLEQYLIEQWEGALLLVTHDRYFLDRIVERTLEIEAGKLLSFEGGWEEYLIAKAERETALDKEARNRANFLRKELEWLCRQPKARTTKSKSRIEKIEGRRDEPVRNSDRSLQMHVDQNRLGSTILELRKLGLSVDGKKLASGLDFHLLQGARVGIIGPNGCGKSTLLRTLTSKIPVTDGELIVGKNTIFAYLDQHRSGLNFEESILDNVSQGQLSVMLGEQSIVAQSYVDRFGFKGYKQQQKVGSLSGGEKARVALAKLLLQTANVFILDEPTNDLDVFTLASVESLLLDNHLTALVVTHDRYFLDRMATDILAFQDDGTVLHIAGNYTQYRHYLSQVVSKKKQAIAEQNAQDKANRDSKKAEAVSQAPAAVSAPPPRAKKLSYKENEELKALPAKIEKLETSIAELEAWLANPTNYVESKEKLPEVMQKLEASRAELEQTMERWMELEG